MTADSRTSRFHALVRRGSFARNVALLSGGAAFGQGLLVASSPILTRLYGPAGFGLLAVFMSAVMILNTIASLRYEVAIPVARSDRSARALLHLSMLLVTVTSVVSGLCIAVFRDSIVDLYDVALNWALFIVLPITLLGTGAYQAFSYWAIRQRAFAVVARTKVNQGLGTVVGQIGLGLLNAGPIGLLLGDAAGRVAGVTTLARLAHSSAPGWFRTSPRHLLAVARSYRRFAFLGAPAALLNIAALQLPALLLASLYGPAAAGLFALAQRVVGLPSRLAGQAIAQVFLGEAAVLVRSNPARLQRLFERTLARLALGGFVLSAILAVAAPQAFRLVFGGEWSEAGRLTQILAVPFALQFVASPLSQTLVVVGRQEQQLIFDAVRSILVIAAFVLASKSEWGLTAAIGAYSVAMAATYLVFLVVCWRAVKDAAGPLRFAPGLST